MNETVIAEAAETYVHDVTRALGFARGARPTALAMAERAMGACCLAWTADDAPEAVVRSVGASWWQIQVRRSATRERAHWLVAHRLSTWLLAQDGVDRATAGVLRAAVAGAMLLPADVVTRAPADVVASRLAVPVAAALLRSGEVTGTPTAVVGRGWYRVRGDHVGRFPRDLATLSAWAHGVVEPLRVRRVRPHGEREIVLVAALPLRALRGHDLRGLPVGELAVARCGCGRRSGAGLPRLRLDPQREREQLRVARGPLLH